MGEAVAKMNRLREGNRWEKSERQGGKRERQKDGGAHETGCGGTEKKCVGGRGGRDRETEAEGGEKEEAGGQTERLG